MNRARLLLLVALALAAALATPAQQAVLLVEAPQGCDFPLWRAELKARGVTLRHAFPPAGGLVVPDDVESALPVEALVPKGTQVYPFSPSTENALRLTATEPGRLLWHAHRALLGLASDRLPEATEPGAPLSGDALVAEDAQPRIVCSAANIARTTSEYMLGSITVTIILPESTGMGTENWTSTEETSVVNEITEGCNDLSTYYTGFGGPASQRPTWTYHLISGRTDTRAQVAVEPISNPGPVSGSLSWVATIWNALGYSAYTDLEKGRILNRDQRASDGTDWAYTVFVADSSVDTDGYFSDSRFAYSYYGGPYVMMTYDNDNWGIGSMNKVHRHESGHTFYAQDEYASSGCTCAGTSGYIAYADQNCNASCASNVDCIMNEAARQTGVCSYTRGMIGWGDSDTDGYPDPVDIAPTTALTAYVPDPSPLATITLNGSAAIAALTNQNIYNTRCDVNVLKLANVQWRVDSGSWQNATASDGAFDGASENYSFTAGPLASGAHTLETRAVDELGQADASFASDTVTITPGNPPGVPDGSGGKNPLRGAKVDTAGSSLTVTWDTSCIPAIWSLVWGGGSGLPTSYGGTYALSGSGCSIGSGSYTWTSTPNPASDPRGFIWFLVVANNGAGSEGSWGKNSGPQERAGAGTGGASNQCGCTAKSLVNTCGQ